MKDDSKQRINMNLKGILTVSNLEESLDGNNQEIHARKDRRKQFLKPLDKSIQGENNDSSTQVDSSISSSISDAIVRFSKVSIREYEIVPGCNPSVSEGCPISLGWRHAEEKNLMFHAFENKRESRRRRQNQMRMPKSYREDILIDFGYTKKEIKKADKDAHKIRTKRLSNMPK